MRARRLTGFSDNKLLSCFFVYSQSNELDLLRRGFVWMGISRIEIEAQNVTIFGIAFPSDWMSISLDVDDYLTIWAFLSYNIVQRPEYQLFTIRLKPYEPASPVYSNMSLPPVWLVLDLPHVDRSLVVTNYFFARRYQLVQVL